MFKQTNRPQRHTQFDRFKHILKILDHIILCRMALKCLFFVLKLILWHTHTSIDTRLTSTGINIQSEPCAHPRVRVTWHRRGRGCCVVHFNKFSLCLYNCPVQLQHGMFLFTPLFQHDTYFSSFGFCVMLFSFSYNFNNSALF